MNPENFVEALKSQARKEIIKELQFQFIKEKDFASLKILKALEVTQ